MKNLSESGLNIPKSKEKDDKQEQNSSVSTETSTIPKAVTLNDIKAQTREWDDRCILGRGRTCHVYKSTSTDHHEIVAYKRVLTEPLDNEFRNESFFLNNLKHENIVKFKGVCTNKNEKIIALEYVPNGTLFDRLQGTGENVLGWETRMKVALGAARAIRYMHRATEIPVIHRDIKSTHILLDETDNAKLIDFGQAAFEKRRSNYIVGTEPYTAPYCKQDYASMTNWDIYSFGVVLLEIITGRKPILNEEPITEWVNNQLVNANWNTVVPTMVDEKIRHTVPPQDMMRMMRLATDCINRLLLEQPNAAQVITRLLKISCLTREAPSSSGGGGRKSSLPTIIE